ncbi:MAG TPA: VanZ family protein [Patescibacteria group bacterium]|nr:VanZ family protein [Patescibacteria group bacterium]
MQTASRSVVLFTRGGLLLLWMMVIFTFSSLSGSAYPFEPPLLYYLERKGAHFVEYAILMLLAVRFVFILFPHEVLKKILAVAAVFAITYGVMDELHQFFVPYRGAKMSDVLIDGLGVGMMGLGIWLVAYLRYQKTPPRSE